MAFPNERRLSLPRAAKEVGRSRQYVRRLVEEQKVRAFRRGGSAKAPWLELYVSELNTAVERDTLYLPPAARRAAAGPPEQRTEGRRSRTSVPMDPAAAAM